MIPGNAAHVARALCVAICIGFAGTSAPLFAQETDHTLHARPAPAETQADVPPAEDGEGMDHAAMDHPATDHAGMGHGMARPDATADPDVSATQAPRELIPPVTPADRAAAFPQLAAHAMHGTSIHGLAMLDRLETWDAGQDDALAWEGDGWIGTDLDRIHVRSEGKSFGGNVESARVELLYGRAIAPWWDAVVGLRHDFGDDPSRTFAAVGLSGLAPYMFELEATAYLGRSGQTGIGIEAEHETLVTNRLILQSGVEAEVWGKDDHRAGIASGLGKVEAGLRLRYEFTRRFAPYIGIVHERLYGGTADLRRAQGDDVEDTRAVFGVRTWF